MTTPAIPLVFLLGLGAGLLISGLVWFVLWLQFRRLRGRLGVRGPPFEPRGTGPAERGPATEASAPLLPPPALAANGPMGPEPESGRARSTPLTRGEPPSGELPDRPPPDPPVEGAVQLSHRVLLHIYRQGTLAADEVAPRALSQAGMIEALGARQGALAGVLRRLEAAGAVSAETTHVRGGQRRVKVYRLTDRGVELARELRPARGRRDPPG